MRKIFPDHWSFMLGEVALYSFIIIILTGVYLTLFFHPSMNEVEYHGSYVPMQGVQMSEAFASTLDISFDVRGGLLDPADPPLGGADLPRRRCSCT